MKTLADVAMDWAENQIDVATDLKMTDRRRHQVLNLALRVMEELGMKLELTRDQAARRSLVIAQIHIAEGGTVNDD